jgi:sulfotransferase family protein
MLKFVICGMEHSGTTLLSDLFRQVPGIDAGFEVGVLLCSSPKEFEGFDPRGDPFFDNMLEGWGLTREELTEACHAEDFDGFYARVKASSKVLRPGTTDIFDKTPRYLRFLDDCMSRADVPFIATFKDPRSIVFSDFARSENKDFDAWYPAYLPAKRQYLTRSYQSYQKVRARNEGKVAFVALESLCMDARASCERLFKHVGLEFKTEYVLLSNQRYYQTRANSISARIPFEYKEHLSDGQQRRIMDDFAECEDWFYE